MRSNSQYEQDSTTSFRGSIRSAIPRLPACSFAQGTGPPAARDAGRFDCGDRLRRHRPDRFPPGGTPLSPLARRMIDHWREEGSRLVATITASGGFPPPRYDRRRATACGMRSHVTSPRLAVSNVAGDSAFRRLVDTGGVRRCSPDVVALRPTGLHPHRRRQCTADASEGSDTISFAGKRERIFGRVSMMIGGRRLRLGVEPPMKLLRVRRSMWNRKQFPSSARVSGKDCDRVSRNKPHAHKTAGRLDQGAGRLERRNASSSSTRRTARTRAARGHPSS